MHICLDFFSCVDCMGCYRHLVIFHVNSTIKNIFTKNIDEVFNTYFTPYTVLKQSSDK